MGDYAPLIDDRTPENRYTVFLADNRTPLERLVAPPQVYRHYKGSHYSVVCVSRHSETLEWLVTYRLTNRSDQFWTRPLAMFVGNLPDGRPRFERRE